LQPKSHSREDAFEPQIHGCLTCQDGRGVSSDRMWKAWASKSSAAPFHWVNSVKTRRICMSRVEKLLAA
jgi:hypothetical protein